VIVLAKRGTTKFKSNLQEELVALEVKGKVQIASGALSDKADVKSKEFLIECKTTEKDKYKLHYSTWNKVFDEAMKLCKCPLMSIDLSDENINIFKDSKRLCIMRYDDFVYYNLATGNEKDMIFDYQRMFNKSISISKHDEGAKLISPLVESPLVVIPWKSLVRFVDKMSEEGDL
jgi:hypothetical protein